MTTFINRLVYFAWISGVFSILFGYIPYYRVICRVNFWCFSILFGYLTTGSYVAWISGVFCIPFGYLTIGSYFAWISGVFLHTFWLPNYRVIWCVNFWCFFHTFWLPNYRVICCVNFWCFLHTFWFLVQISKMCDKKMIVLKIVLKKSIASLHRLTQAVQNTNALT